MTVGRKIIRDSEGNRRGVDEVLQHVLRGWFPINRVVFNEVRQKADQGEYERFPRKLFDDLKKDQALLMMCLHQIKGLIDGNISTQTPADVLASLEKERILRLLSLPESTLSTHSIDTSSKAHTMRIRHSVISSSTAEVLAEGAKLNPQDAHVCAGIRQLGLNLVAWNYPRIYSKALAAVSKSDNSLEQELLKILGYSPMQLGVKAAVDWCESTDLRLVLDGEEKNGNASSPTSKVLKRFCEVGETLALASDPEFFPSAAGRWASVLKEVNQHLGAEGIARIQQKIESNCAAYSVLSPAALKIDIRPDTTVKVAFSNFGLRLLDQNLHAVRCPALLQERFRSVYEAILPGQPSPTAVKELVDFVIPALGFTRGCVYLIDQKKVKAIPMLRVGDVPLERFRPLNCQETGSQIHPVVEALSYSAPIVQENAFLNGDRVSHVTGVFGTREKVGVLYLEMSRDLSANDRQQVLTYFKAVRQCLNDCLNMK